MLSLLLLNLQLLLNPLLDYLDSSDSLKKEKLLVVKEPNPLVVPNPLLVLVKLLVKNLLNPLLVPKPLLVPNPLLVPKPLLLPNPLEERKQPHKRNQQEPVPVPKLMLLLTLQNIPRLRQLELRKWESIRNL